MSSSALRSGPSARVGARRHGRGCGRLARAAPVCSALVLRPSGSGSSLHLGDVDVSPPVEYVLKPGRQEVGRSPAMDFVIPIPSVSGRHALLEVIDDETLEVTDLQSTNGTYVNGVECEPLQPLKVFVGSTIIFGDEALAKFALEVVAATASSESGGEEPATAAP